MLTNHSKISQKLRIISIRVRNKECFFMNHMCYCESQETHSNLLWVDFARGSDVRAKIYQMHRNFDHKSTKYPAIRLEQYLSGNRPVFKKRVFEWRHRWYIRCGLENFTEINGQITVQNIEIKFRHIVISVTWEVCGNSRSLMIVKCFLHPPFDATIHTIWILV